jgi:hypothetical protein
MRICHCDTRGADAISLACGKAVHRADAGIAWGRIRVSGRKLFGMATAMTMTRPQRMTSVLPSGATAARCLR